MGWCLVFDSIRLVSFDFDSKWKYRIENWTKKIRNRGKTENHTKPNHSNNRIYSWSSRMMFFSFFGMNGSFQSLRSPLSLSPSSSFLLFHFSLQFYDANSMCAASMQLLHFCPRIIYFPIGNLKNLPIPHKHVCAQTTNAWDDVCTVHMKRKRMQNKNLPLNWK